MGFLDKAKDIAGGGFGGERHDSLIVQKLFEMVRGHEGGLDGLLKRFEVAGLGSKVQSWVGTGQNEQISPDEVEKGLGSDNVKQIANQTGLTHEETKSKIAGILPNLVDRLTPNGQVPDKSSLSGMIGKFFGRDAA